MLVHWIWYSMLPKLTLRQKYALLERFSDPEEIYGIEDFSHMPEIPGEIGQILEDKDLTTARQVIKSCAQKHISILTKGDAAYPYRLHNIHDAPLVLYCKGELPDLQDRPVISVVGTRKASAYGLRNARKMAMEIAACGGLVVSGGAAGIDSMALEGALAAGGKVVAVLGCGPDVVYPRNNRQLFEKIANNGCLLSEYIPGTEPRPWQFPERNRILSGMADGVFVVEAPQKSGALITARHAFEQGRDVFAVPGNIDVPNYEGSNALLQECAAAVLTGWDVMKEYAGQYPATVEKREPKLQKAYDDALSPAILQVAQTPQIPGVEWHGDKKAIDNPASNAYIDLDAILSKLDPDERKIVSCLGAEPIPAERIIERAELPAAKVLGILTKLALKGVVVNHPGRLVSLKNQ